MRQGRMCCSYTERNTGLNIDPFCPPSQLLVELCPLICSKCTASPQNRCTETGRPYIILYYHYCGAQDMGPDRTDMRAGLAQVAVPLEEVVAGEGGGFAINPQTLIFFVFATANCCGCCSGTLPAPCPCLYLCSVPCRPGLAGLPQEPTPAAPPRGTLPGLKRTIADATLDAD